MFDAIVTGLSGTYIFYTTDFYLIPVVRFDMFVLIMIGNLFYLQFF